MYLWQDNYWEYGQALLGKRHFSPDDKRLFPATGILFAAMGIFIADKIVAGAIISLIFVVVSYLLIRKINSEISPFFLLCFPPIVFKSFSLISSESFMIIVLLASFLLWKNNRKNLSYIALGLLLWIRLIGIAVILARVFLDFQEKNIFQAIKGLVITVLSIGIFLCYNQLLFHNPLIQLLVYPQAGHASIALLQFTQDIFRSFNNGQYRIFFSGVIYFILLGVYFFFGWKKRNNNTFSKYIFLSSVMMTIFVFTLGPTPFLEEYARFLVPVFLCLGLLIPQMQKKFIPVFVLISILVTLF